MSMAAVAALIAGSEDHLLISEEVSSTGSTLARAAVPLLFPPGGCMLAGGVSLAAAAVITPASAAWLAAEFSGVGIGFGEMTVGAIGMTGKALFKATDTVADAVTSRSATALNTAAKTDFDTIALKKTVFETIGEMYL